MDQALEERLHQLRDRPAGVTGDLSALGPAVDPASVWQRGKRWQRRRRLTTLAGVGLAVALTAGSVLLGLDTGTEAVQPARTEVSVGVPRTVHTPTGDLPEYPKEPAVAVFVPRDDKGVGDVYALSATSGSYGKLELEGLADPSVGLSRDGRYLAYWAAGPTTKAPTPFFEGLPTAGAVVVRDLTTGAVDRASISTPHGVAGGRFRWTRSGELRLTSYRAGGAKGDADIIADRWGRDGTWRPGDGFTIGPLKSNLWEPTAAGERSDGSHVVLRPQVLRLSRADNSVVQTWRNGLPRTRVTHGDGPALAGDRVAYAFPVRSRMNGHSDEDFRLLVATLDPKTEELVWKELGKPRHQTVVGWRGDDILVSEYADNSRRFVSVDPETAERTVVSTGWPGDVAYHTASDVLQDAPLVDGVEPGAAGSGEKSINWVVAGSVASVSLVLVGLGVLVWRRRVHA